MLILRTLDPYVHNEYIIVYVHTTLAPENEPSFAWLRKVYELFDKRREQPAEIGALLLIDRDVDLVSPMCTELTYEGLLHATFGIAHGYVDLEPELLGAPPPAAGAPRTLKREMNNNDPL